MTEREIIEGLKGNQQLAFDRVFDEFFPQLQFFATRVTGDAEEARDIVNQVFLSLWKLRSRFETLVNIKAFLYITTRNHCFNYLRHRQRQETVKKEYGNSLEDVADEQNMELRMIETEVMKKVYEKIEELPDKCKQIFKLTYLEGLQAGEIAQKLNISTSTVTTQRHIGIKYLRAVLSEEDFLVLLLLINGSLSLIPHFA
ncbi:RNA polymerase, sigma-24 subunit, ECF subfamily [Niastella koreensis GR20-10]|uniref:RNA polymerase, sigma-24 subunit, ECF subfamily n=2 Tax=Niastella koreensis TaxID=354356 RepID=G8TLY5_NIAKG|nr:RNA polymerase sigma-70 factor [Niastella koreensis]AEV98745.1 RNA polymerase, sigma-24 subunit, ECF subfamily [Niastella koreensis GR20-10]